MEIIGWILLALVIFVIVIAAAVLFIPWRILIEYVDTWKLQVRVFGVIPVYTFCGPLSDLLKEEEKEPKPAAKPSAAPKKATSGKESSLETQLRELYEEEGVRGILKLLESLLKLFGGVLKRAAPFVTVRSLSLCVRVGDEEADKTAVRCGQISAALFPLLTALGTVLRFKKRTVVVQPDFMSETVSAKMRMRVWVWPFGILYALLYALVQFIILRNKVFAESPEVSAKPNTTTSTS